MDIKKGYRKYHNIVYSKNRLINSILNNINYLLHVKKYENKDILNYFETKNPQETLKIYCDSKEKYHYLTLKKDKINFIENVLNIKGLPIEIIDTIVSFENKGLYLLYILLYYWSEIDKKKLAKYREKTYSEEKLNKGDIEFFSRSYLNINSLSNEEVEMVLEEIKELKELILKRLNNKNIDRSCNEEIDIIEKVTIQVLKEKASVLSADACMSIIKNVYSSNIILDVFSNHLVEVLKREEVLING
jgi:hypothetical protein